MGNKKPQLLFPNEIAVSNRTLPRQLPEGCRAGSVCAVLERGEPGAWVTWGFLKSGWLERFQILNCLQNKTFIGKLGIDRHYFKLVCEIITA